MVSSADAERASTFKVDRCLLGLSAKRRTLLVLWRVVAKVIHTDSEVSSLLLHASL